MNQIENTLNIDTPENVTFGYEIAGLGSRFLAALIDTALITLLQVLGAVLAALLMSQNSRNGLGLDSITSSWSAWAVAIVSLISMFFYWGYYIFFEMLWNGKSPGKKAVRLRVIRVDGTPITITESIVRNLVRIIDFMPAYYGVGAIAIFINPQTRRLGDLAAGTVVVRDLNQAAQFKNLAALQNQAQKVPIYMKSSSVVQAPVDPSSAATTLVFPIELLSDQDIQMIEIYFQRRNQLTNRNVLASQLINNLWGKMKLSEAPPVKDAAEETLAKILFEYGQRASH